MSTIHLDCFYCAFHIGQMTSFQRGDISIDPKTQFRRVHDGTKWRRLCSISDCPKRVQIKGLCARHLRENQRLISDSSNLSINDCTMMIHRQNESSTGETSPFEHPFSIDDINATSSPWSSSQSTSFSFPQKEHSIPHCQYRISLEDTSGCLQNVCYRCNHCSLGFCYAHSLEHRQYIKSMYDYLREKISLQNSTQSATVNDHVGDSRLMIESKENVSNYSLERSIKEENLNSDDPLDDVMDWLEEQKSYTDNKTMTDDEIFDLLMVKNQDSTEQVTSTTDDKHDAGKSNFTITDDRVNLNMSKQQLKDDDVRIIATFAMENSERIQSLDCSNNQISGRGVEYLSNALKTNQTVKSLNLRNNQIQDLGLRHLSLALRVNNTLTHLDISNNQIHFDGMSHLGQALMVNETLIALDLGHNFIESSGMRSLSTGLLKNHSLKSLDLRCNQIDIRGIRYLSEALRINRTLTSLNLAYNFIGNTGAFYLGQAMQLNESLLVVNVHCTGIGQEGMNYLSEQLLNSQIELRTDTNKDTC